jgi:hypothetical protein
MDGSALLPRIDARIVLEHENQQAIACAIAQTIPSYELDSFSGRRVEQFVFESSNNLFQQGRWKEASDQYQKIIKTQAGDAEALLEIKRVF